MILALHLASKVCLGTKMVTASKHSNLVTISSQMAMEKEISFLSEAMAKKGVAGFMSSTPKFEEYVQDGVSYIRFAGVLRDVERGALKQTDQKLDIATTKGYFSVMTPQGVRYTRNGHFRLSPTREVINTDGYTLLNEGNAPIVLEDSENVLIGKDGTISTANGVIGRVKIVEFKDEQKLNDDDLIGYFKSADPEVVPQDYQVHQGFLEESNVDAIKTLSRFSILSNRWKASHQIQKRNDDFELEAPSKLAPVHN